MILAVWNTFDRNFPIETCGRHFIPQMNGVYVSEHLNLVLGLQLTIEHRFGHIDLLSSIAHQKANIAELRIQEVLAERLLNVQR